MLCISSQPGHHLPFDARQKPPRRALGPRAACYRQLKAIWNNGFEITLPRQENCAPNGMKIRTPMSLNFRCFLCISEITNLNVDPLRHPRRNQNNVTLCLAAKSGPNSIRKRNTSMRKLALLASVLLLSAGSASAANVVETAN